MPKRKALKVTPFTLFMQHRKKVLSDEGITFEGGWKDVAQHINEEWLIMDESEKSSWTEKAEGTNERAEFRRMEDHSILNPSNPPHEKIFLNCEVQNPEATIIGYFRTLRCPLEEATFPVVHFNSYGRYYSHIWIPSEYGLGSFSLKNGIGEESWNGNIIDPGNLPQEVSMVDVSEQMTKTLVPQPPYFLRPGLSYYSGMHTQEEFTKIFNDIVEHSLLMEDSKTGRRLYILFAPDENDITVIRGCILWLMMKCAQKFDFEILNLTTLMKVLSFQKTHDNYEAVGIWSEKNARTTLNDSLLTFVRSLACKWHQREENALAISHCATSIVIRSIYLALGSLCIVFGIDSSVPSPAEMDKNCPPQSGLEITAMIEFRQRFGLEEVDEPTRKLLRKGFIVENFLPKLKRKYPYGLKQQPKKIIWPKWADIEKDLNYSDKADVIIKKSEDPPSDDEPEVFDWNWSGNAQDDGNVQNGANIQNGGNTRNGSNARGRGYQ